MITRRVIGYPLLICLAYSLSASALFFRLPPNGKECLGVETSSGEELYVNWEAIGGDRSVRVLINADNKELFADTNATGTHRMKIDHPGLYKICFKSLMSYVQTLSFTIRLQKTDAHPEELATMDDSKKLETLVNQLESKVFELSAQQSYTTTREAVHRELSEKTNSRVVLWTSLEVIVWIVSAAFQIFYLKSFFEVKHFV